MKNKIYISVGCCLFLAFASCNKTIEETEYTGHELAELHTQLNQGWNTWNTRSALSHVLLPEGIAIDLHLKDGGTGEILKEALMGRRGENVENVTPGRRSYDGSYIALSVTWHGMELKVESAAVDDEFHLLIQPIHASELDSIVIHPYLIWDRAGKVSVDQHIARLQTPSKRIDLHTMARAYRSDGKEIKVPMDRPVALSTSGQMEIEAVKKILADAKKRLERQQAKYESIDTVYQAVQNALAWNVIYEPGHDRVIMPVSRIWNCQWKGWVLFDWDTYFGAHMLSMDEKSLAYANALAMTKSITERGFIPNFAAARTVSEDRSQPPVGTFVVNQIYRQHQEKWFLHETFDELLSWNRWWATNRDVDGYLCWGSDEYDTSETPEWLKKHVGKKVAGMWETGLDNSPMYDDVFFDEEIDKLMLADVGLMSMYIWDCHHLAEIAKALNKPMIEQEILERAEKYASKLETLWDEESGIYLNKDIVTGAFSDRLSPTNFYPLLAKVPSQQQARRMVDEHFYNPEEFWGTYIMPSIARNDPGYKDMVYWRGRIWGPMNYLVYLGLANYDLPNARKDMVERSKKLLLQSWNFEKHIYENYNAETGQGDDVESSDKFYHWGALLGFINLMDEGYILAPSGSVLERHKN